MPAIDIIQHKKVAGTTTDYPVKDSAMIDALQPAAASVVWPLGYKPATTAGLTLGLYGGNLLVDGALSLLADTTLALTAAATNYVEMSRAGVVSANVTGFTAGRIPLYTVVTSGAAIATLTDVRAFNQPGHARLVKATTGGTSVLTADEARVQAIDVTGVLVSNAVFEVPAAPWAWLINNGTTGAFSLTIKVAGQAGVTVPQGKRRSCICDGTDVRALSGYVASDGDTMTGGLTVASGNIAVSAGTVTVSADPTTALQVATKQYADALVVGLLDDRGNFDASGNVFPSSGGSGTAGAVKKGDLWYISVAGTLGGVGVAVGNTVRALVDTPGQTAGNWDILAVNVEAASTTVAGRVELATTAETQTGTDAVRAVTPAGLAATAAYQGRQTVWIPAAAMTARTTNGAAIGTVETATNKLMLKTLDYDQTTAEYAQFSVAMPKSWDRGTVAAQAVWSVATGTGNVVWAVQAVAISDDDVIDTAFGAAQSVTDGVTAVGDLMQSAETAAITIAGTPAALDLVVFQVYRDAANGSDTLAADARLHGIRLYITTNAKNDV